MATVDTPVRRVRMRLSHRRDVVAVLAIWLFTGLVSQRWTGLDTPDSSFYASMSLFGSEVADRAPFDSYWWTRLGVIAPNRLLTEVLGPWWGFGAYRMLLLLMLVTASMLILRRYTRSRTAAALTLLISLNTVVLSYLGNPYLTGSVLAGTVALIACALSGTRTAAITSGALLGWLVMVNPPGVLLAGTLWLAIRIHRRTSIGSILIAAIATVVSFAVFLIAGLVIFPGKNWFAAYLDAQAIELSNFASTDLVWLRDISLLVPLAILIITVIVWFWNRSVPAARLAFLISAVSIAFMLVFSPMMGGIALEAPFYQAMLWPPALIALALTAAAVTRTSGWSVSAIGILIAGVVVLILAGRWPGALSLGVGVALAIALVVVAAGLLLVAEFTGSKVALALLAVTIMLTGAQLLQNSRGPMGLYYLSPYHWAFSANPISSKIHTAVGAQEWLLSKTTSDDRILLWVGGNWVGGDRELYVVGGMQLWGGENLVTLAPTLDESGDRKLREIRPSVLALIAPTTQQVIDFWATLPLEVNPTPPECTDFVWSATPDQATWTNPAPVTQGHSCLTRLTWAD